MILLLLACAEGEVDSAAPPAPDTLPAKWTTVDLSCQGDAAVLEGWSQGTQASSALIVISGHDVALGAVTGTHSWDALGADPAGGWQHWQLIGVLAPLPCDAIDAWQAQLLDSQGALLACLDDQGLAC